MTNRQMTAGLRIASMLIDHFIMTIAAMLICLPAIIIFVSGSIEDPHGNPAGSPFPVYLIVLGFALYLCKDAFNGRSIAKRILGHQVIDKRTGQAANPLKCLVRNIFCFLWPVEVIMVLVNPESRLGDKVAGTEVVYFDREQIQPKSQLSKALLSLLLAYAIAFILSFPFILLSKVINAPSDLDEAYYNKELSLSANQRFTDSTGMYLVPDIRIYDRTKTAGKAYVSAVFNLREDYELDDENYDSFKKYCSDLLTVIMDNKPFTGRMKFVYDHGSRMSVRVSNIGQ